MQNAIDILVAELGDLDSVLRAAVTTLRDHGVSVAAAAAIYDSEASRVGRILLESANDKPFALQILSRAQIDVRSN